MANRLMRVVADEVLVRSQPKRVIKTLVRSARVLYGQILEVRADSRSEVDGYVWWEHARHPGWWSASGRIGGEIFMEDYTPPVDAVSAGLTVPAADVVTFRVAVDTVNVRHAPGGELAAGEMLWYGSRVDFRASSRTVANGFFWWAQVNHPERWSASGSTDGKQVMMLPAHDGDALNAPRRLEVPWAAQPDRSTPDGSDGALACLLMLLRYYGRVDDAMRVNDLSPMSSGDMNVMALQTLAAAYHLATSILDLPADASALTLLRDLIQAGKPVLLPVRYKPLGLNNPYQRSQNIDHWITLSGVDGDTFLIHDALWLSWDSGTFLRVPADRLLNACSQTASFPGRVCGLY